MPQLITVASLSPGQNCSIGNCKNEAVISLGATIRVKLGFLNSQHTVLAPICEECKSQLLAGLQNPIS